MPPPLSRAALARRRAAPARAAMERERAQDALRRASVRAQRRRRRAVDAAGLMVAFVASGWFFQGWPAPEAAAAVGLARALAGLWAGLAFDWWRGYHVVGIFGVACLADTAATGAWLEYRLYDVSWLRDSIIRWLVLTAIGATLGRLRRVDQLEGL